MRLEEVMWPNKYVLVALGLWPMPADATLVRQLFANFRFIVGLSGLFCLLVPEILTVVAYWGDIDILGDFGSLAVIQTLLMFKNLYFFLRRRSFHSMYQHLKDFWDTSDNPRERELVEQLANVAKVMSIVLFLVALSNIISLEAAALINWLKNRREINEGLRNRPLFIGLYYPLNIERTPIYELVFACQSFGGICAVFLVCGFDCTVMVFIVHTSAQFRLIAARFRTIGRKISEQTILMNEHEVRARIGKCVSQHQRTTKVAEELNSLLSLILFCQIMCSGLMICLSGYALIEGGGGAVEICKFLVVFVSLLIELILCCAPPELLIQESTAIAETIYCEVPWFRLTPSLRRDLGFVMMRAQKACHISALYQVMSIFRITEVFNAAGSYMALLRSMKK